LRATRSSILVLGLTFLAGAARAQEAVQEQVAMPPECATGMECPMGQFCEDGHCVGKQTRTGPVEDVAPLPSRAPEDDRLFRNDGSPPGFHFESHRRWKLFYAGLGLFTLAWAITIPVAAAIPLPSLAIPGGSFYWGFEVLAGGVCKNCGSTLGATAVFDGVAQAAGLAMAVVGVLTSDRVEVPDRPSATIVPLILPRGGGMGVVARF
jgi:hypothetical protein